MKRVGRVFEYLAGCGLVTALVLAPTQWSFTAARGINVSPGDLLLLPVAGCWLLGVLVTGRWRRLVPCRGFASGIVPHPFWRFWPHALLVLIAAVSVGVAADRAAAVKEVVQLRPRSSLGDWRSYSRLFSHRCSLTFPWPSCSTSIRDSRTLRFVACFSTGMCWVAIWR
jgi:hypothetical protein